MIRSNAGLEFPIYPHMLRHAMGYYLANNGVDTRTMRAAATAAQGRLRPLFHLNCSQAQRSLIANASVSVRPGVMLPTKNGQSDQALVDASKASGAT